MDLPLYLVFGDRPVKFERTPDGGMDVLAFDWKTAAFVRDPSYLSRYFRFEPEMEVLTRDAFDEKVLELVRRRGGCN